MSDTLGVDGRNWHKMNMTKMNVRHVPISMDKIVDFDLKNFKLAVKDDFDFEQLMGSQARNSDLDMIKFCANLTRDIDPNQISGNLDFFIDELVKYHQMKSRLEVLHEPEQLLAALDELKICLMQIQLHHDTMLNKLDKLKVSKAMDERKFSQMIKAIKEDLFK